MNTSGVLPVAASSIAPRVDALFYTVLGVTGGVAIAIAICIVTFAIKYRAGSRANRSIAHGSHPRIETAWIGVPLLIFLCIFGWSSLVFSQYYKPPRNALQLYGIGKQWMWKIEHENGRREIDELHVPVNRPIQLVLTSQDVIHSFFIPAFRIKRDVLPGRYLSVWFTATRLGHFELFCAEYCGTEHAHMRGNVVVMSQPEYARWLDATGAPLALARHGFDLFREHGCSGCHEPSSTVHAPSLDRIFGSTVHLRDGQSISTLR